VRSRGLVKQVRIAATHDPTPHESRSSGVHALRFRKSGVRRGLISPTERGEHRLRGDDRSTRPSHSWRGS
jgi:hypothetical protein